ncbi:hypothetical protein DRO91_08965, partial [Candidatus Heimdallarchaeota archaeon]
SSFGADLDECLFIRGDDNIVDLRSHQTTAIPTKLLNLDPEEFESNLSNIFPDSLIVRLKNFPNVYYATSSISLAKQKGFWIFVLVGICFVIFFLSVSFAVIIAKKNERAHR